MTTPGSAQKIMTESSFYWHDYETFGADPRRDRPVQFAGQRTDLELNPVGEPLSIMCRPAGDYLPQPAAVLITGITPQAALAEGLHECEFAALVHEQLVAPGTCGVGYNSIRFDDEVTRFLLYRNFYDPYEREYRDGNSRWDLIDVARLCYALRPDGVNWPRRDDGLPSFRLEHLTAANGIDHGQAHDALADVRATIDFARLLRRAQPRLFDYAFAQRGKAACRAMLDFASIRPVLHVSSRYPASRGALAMVAPLCEHPENRNAVIVFDLAADPQPLIELNAEEIEDRIFTPAADMPEGVERIPLKSVSVNHAPVLAPVSTLKGADLARIGMDPARCQAHLERLQNASGPVAEKVRQVFSRSADRTAATDPEWDLYGAGFATDHDRQLLGEVRRSPPQALADLGERFQEARFQQLLFRYRAKNHPATLSAAEQQAWLNHCRQRLTAGQPSAVDRFDTALAAFRNSAEAAHQPLLDALQAWRDEVLSACAY